jgi:CRISPR-associated protein Csb1
VLTFPELSTAVRTASAIRVTTKLQPSGGPADKVFPPTYGAKGGVDGACYSFEERVLPNGEIVRCHLIDSVQSQANRFEEALNDAIDEERVRLPRLVLDFAGTDHAELGRLSSLQAPHRIADAYFRDAELDGKNFRNTPQGRRFEAATTRHASAIFELDPCSLIFGYWNSTGLEKGRPQSRVHRSLTSEIVAIGTVPGERSSSRIDPYFTGSGVTVYEGPDGQPAFQQQKKKYGDGKPSEINLGNILPTVSGLGGVTMRYAEQKTVLSLAALRTLRFPDDEGAVSRDRDHAAHAVLASIALVAIELQREAGYWLRSRCDLYAAEPPVREIVGGAGTTFDLDTAAAILLFDAACEEARSHGLAWNQYDWSLTPGERLLSWAGAAKAAMSGGEG